MEISDYVAAPYQGVSQSPPQVRLQGTCDEMEDCMSTIPMGAQKRPPFTWTGPLFKADGVTPIVADPEAVWYEVLRGSAGADCALLLNRESGVIQPYLFLISDMSPVTVTWDDDALTYLRANSPTPNSQIKCCTIEDVTFITNRTVQVADGTATQATRPYECLLWVETGHYSANYKVTITPASTGTPISAQYTPSTGASGDDAWGVGTDCIANGLYSGTIPSSSNAGFVGTPLESALTPLGYTVTLNGSTIYISHPTDDFTVAVADDQGGTAMIAIKGEVQEFSDLPAVAVDGLVVRIANESAGGYSDYYVQFSAGNATTLGVWNECVAPGANLGIDLTTMPVGLTCTDGVTWELKQLTWTGRTTGDATLSLDPSFVGDYIMDIGWWRGRLCLVYQGGVSLSASDSPYKFYVSTLVTALDSDAIDLLPPIDRKTVFYQAVIFDLRLVVMGDQNVAVVESSGGVTPTLTGIYPLSDTPFTDTVRVQGANHKIYFAAPRTNSLVLYEISIDRLSGLALPEDQTAAVPTYLPLTLDRAATLKTDYITVYGASGSGRLYVRVFRHSQQQQVENAWFAWNLPTGWTIGGLFIEGTILYAAVIDPAGNFQSAQLDLTPDLTDPSGSILTHWDMRVTEAQATSITYSATTGETTVTLPIPVNATLQVSCRQPVVTDGYPEGYLVPIISTTSTTVVLKGDWTDVPLWFGYRYGCTFTPTKFYKMGQDQKPERSGRLTLHRAKADVSAFGHLAAKVTVAGRRPRVTVYEGYNLDDVDTPINGPPLRNTAVLNFSIGGNNERTTIQFMSDSHFGFKYLGCEWQGAWTPKAQRVT